MADAVAAASAAAAVTAASASCSSLALNLGFYSCYSNFGKCFDCACFFGFDYFLGYIMNCCTAFFAITAVSPSQNFTLEFQNR